MRTSWRGFDKVQFCLSRGGIFPQVLTTLREKLIKIGAKVVRHSRKIVFQINLDSSPFSTTNHKNYET